MELEHVGQWNMSGKCWKTQQRPAKRLKNHGKIDGQKTHEAQ